MSGGSDARWSAPGDRLWFRAYGNVLMEVDVSSTGGTFSFGEPRAPDPWLAVLDNGARFLAARRVPDRDGPLPSITVVQNRFAEFAGRRAPAQ